MQLNAIVYSAVRLFAECVAACLSTRPNALVTPCSSLDGVSGMVETSGATLVFLDITDTRVLTAARTLVAAHPAVRVVALALPEVLDQVIACADAGFTSYVPRNASQEDLWGIAERALREEVMCDPKVSSGLLREVRRRGSTSPAATEATPHLTQREREVLHYMSKGMSNKEIARALVLSVATIKNHVHNILSKIRVHNRSEALAQLGFEQRFAAFDDIPLRSARAAEAVRA